MHENTNLLVNNIINTGYCGTAKVSYLINFFILNFIKFFFCRFTFRVIETTLNPDDGTSAIIFKKKIQKRGEDLLVTWSRSTSASSIYR